MPDPKQFKDEKGWMSACMPHLLKIEKKKRDQAIAQCLSMWRQWKKKANDPKDRITAKRVISAFFERESARNPTPGQALKIDRELEKWRKNLDTKISPPLSEMPPYKEGEIIEVLMDGKFVKVPYSEKIKDQTFYYIKPMTKELVKNKPVPI